MKICLYEQFQTNVLIRIRAQIHAQYMCSERQLFDLVAFDTISVVVIYNKSIHAYNASTVPTMMCSPIFV